MCMNVSYTKCWSFCFKHQCVNSIRLSEAYMYQLTRLPSVQIFPWEKNWPPWLLTVSSRWAHRELTVSSRWPKWSQPAVTEPWPGPWLSCDLVWLSRDRRDWAVTSPRPSHDWAVTLPSRDWAVIIGPGAVTTVVTVSMYFLMGWLATCSAPCHYLNLCWLITNWTLGNKFQWNFNQNTTIFNQEN